MSTPRYRRVILKLSGESLGGASSLDHEACDYIAREIKALYDLGVEVGVVIGGGNIFRGAHARYFGLQRTPADHIGMLATAINGLLLGQTLAKRGCKTRVLSAVNLNGMVDVYNWASAMRYLSSGIMLLFVGGTGNPYFTTDTAAAMRASEVGADALIKATKVDGVYDKDPVEHADAVKADRLTYSDVLVRDLHVMDATPIALCRENAIPIHVCNLFSPGALIRAVCDGEGGTLIEA